jgi:hypothetical protein
LVCESISDRGGSMPPCGLDGDCRENFGSAEGDEQSR